MADNGKLEAQITVPTTEHSMSITEVGGGGGPIAVTVLTVGTYYHSSVGSVGASVQSDIATYLTDDPTLLGTYTCSVSAGEGGTGKFTISATGITSFTITWTDTVLRDLLGFDGTESGTLSYTGNDQAEGLWLPGYPYQNLNGGGSWRGHWETDQQVVESARGDVYSVMGRKKRIMELVYPMVTRAKTWVANEATINESFEQFLLDGIYGGAPWGTSSGPIRFYPDADTDATYGSYAVVGLSSWRPSQIREMFTGIWSISLPRLVEVPA